MGAPSNGPKTGKDGRGRGKEKGHAVRRGLGWLVLDRAARWLVIAIAVFLKRDFAFDVIGKRIGAHTVTPRQTCVVIAQTSMR